VPISPALLALLQAAEDTLPGPTWLVAADALEEDGRGTFAYALRWCVSRDRRPLRNGQYGKWWTWYNAGRVQPRRLTPSLLPHVVFRDLYVTGAHSPRFKRYISWRIAIAVLGHSLSRLLRATSVEPWKE
jgi:hypothetical protein